MQDPIDENAESNIEQVQEPIIQAALEFYHYGEWKGIDWSYADLDCQFCREVFRVWTAKDSRPTIKQIEEVILHNLSKSHECHECPEFKCEIVAKSCSRTIVEHVVMKEA